MCGDPEDRHGLEKRKRYEALLVDSVDHLAELDTSSVLFAEGKISIGAFMDRHEGRTEGQVHRCGCR